MTKEEANGYNFLDAQEVKLQNNSRDSAKMEKQMMYRMLEFLDQV